MTELKSSKKKTAKQPQPMLSQLLQRLELAEETNKPIPAKEIGFTSIAPNTPVFAISGEYLPKGQYYVYDTEFSRFQMDTVSRKRAQAFLQAGAVVEPGKPGIRILKPTERKKHEDCCMKVAIPHVNARYGLKATEVIIDQDGASITLCRPHTRWRH
jgi:hypothetical protein